MSSRRIAFRPTAALRVLGGVWSHPANRDGRLTALARVAAFQLRGRLLGQPTVVRLGDRGRILASPGDTGSKRVAYAPWPDWNEMRAWARHLRSGDLFVDVGANVGLYTIFAASLRCKVVAVEPQVEARRRMTANLALNQYEADIVDAALADRPGRREMQGPDSLRRHLVARPTTSEELTGDGDERSDSVAVETLDTLLGSRIAAGVKLDVEGAERLVLEGAGRALAERRIRLLQIEWNDRSMVNFNEGREPVAALLDRHGYELLRPDRDGVLQKLVVPDLGPDVFARPRERP